MRESFTLDQIRRFALIAVVIGVVIGISGAVRTGSIIISLSASIFFLARYSQSQVKRGIELVLPITICALLFILALSLPDAR
jgi:fructose-specific phosphotransferase system IIC component